MTKNRTPGHNVLFPSAQHHLRQSVFSRGTEPENECSSQRGRISLVYKHSPGRLAMVSTGGEVESVVPTLSMRLDASAVPAGTEEGLEGSRGLLVFSPSWKAKEAGFPC